MLSTFAKGVGNRAECGMWWIVALFTTFSTTVLWGLELCARSHFFDKDIVIINLKLMK